MSKRELLGVLMLIVHVILVFLIYSKDMYVGTCYLAILLLYLLESWTNSKLKSEQHAVYLEGMKDGIVFRKGVNERVFLGEEPRQAAKEVFEQYKNKFNEKG